MDDVHLALARFGLGPRPGDRAAVASDPRGYVLSQCDASGAALLAAENLQPTEALIPAFFEARRKRRLALLAREAAAKAQKAVGAIFSGDAVDATTMEVGTMAAGTGTMQAAPADADGMDAGMEADMADAGMEGGKPRRRDRKDAAPEAPAAAKFAAGVMFAETEARYARALSTETPLVERLVMFWSNHFCISGDKGGLVRVIAGAYEREAIRPHVLGRFRDMLGAATTHAAMLTYLDNVRSVGPNSRRADRKRGGLNENLARELLELHTLGVDGGYTQVDVGQLALVLTGWTVDRSGEGSASVFREAFHEPGAFTVLGKTYAETGAGQLQAVLDDLARHPATARHVARKLVRHFVADVPPPGLEDAVAQAFRDSDGDLAATTRALVAADAAWQPPPIKARSPYELCVAAQRATGLPLGRRGVFQVTRSLGQKLWSPPSPAGFPDADDAWFGGDALLERLDWATAYARGTGDRIDAVALGEELFGEQLGEETRMTLKRAESGEQALALLLMSPVLQRR